MWPIFFTMQEIRNLEIDSQVDYCLTNGLWSVAKIIAKSESGLRIELYEDATFRNAKAIKKWCQYSNALHRFAVCGSITPFLDSVLIKAPYRKRVGDFVDINPIVNGKRIGWRIGKVEDRDVHQMKVFYKHKSDLCHYWVHENDLKSVDEYGKYTRIRSDDELEIWFKIRRKINSLRNDSMEYELDENLIKEIIETLFYDMNGCMDFIIDNIKGINKLEEMYTILQKKRTIQSKISDYFRNGIVEDKKYKQTNLNKYIGFIERKEQQFDDKAESNSFFSENE
eukprot:111317_1